MIEIAKMFSIITVSVFLFGVILISYCIITGKSLVERKSEKVNYRDEI